MSGDTTKATFGSILENLKDTAVDFSTLTVTTATGDINAALSSEVEGDDLNNVNMEELFKKAAKGEITSGITIAAIDSYKLDGDAFIFRSNTVPNDDMKTLEQAHSNAVLAGQALRSGIFEIFKDSIQGLVKK